MTDDQKWEFVKNYYEGCYRDAEDPKKDFKFESRPSKKNIEFLYLEAMKFRETYRRLLQEGKLALSNYLDAQQS